MKKLISVLLIPVLLFSVAATGISAGALDYELPLIYIAGYGCPIYLRGTDPDNHDNWIYPVVKDSDMILNYVTENKDILINAVLTQNWSDFDDKLYEIICDLFKDLKLGPDGMPINDTLADYEADYNSAYRRYIMSGSYDPNQWEYHYDWRLDPFDNMELLREYIGYVQQVTGHTQYAIAGRCHGANLALAYMEKYKDPNLKRVIFYASAARGIDPIGEVFSGKIKLDADSVELFLYNTEFGLNYDVGGLFTLTDAVLREIITDLSNLYGLDVALFAVNNAYGKIYEDIIPRTMRETLATFPGFWAMVGNEYYDDAMKLIFGGYEEEYAGLIEKIEHFHNTVGVRNIAIIKEAQQRGTKVYNIVKYGMPMWPVSERGKDLGDGFCTVRDASFGATACKIDETFNEKYIKAREEQGNGKYISPDKRIDASTSILRDTTWFVSNIIHDEFYIEGDEEILHSILTRDDFDIYSDEKYPQYLTYDKENDKFVPADNTTTTVVDTWNEATDTAGRKMKPFLKFFYYIAAAFIALISFRFRYYD